ncbi:hypothetical protein Tco_0129256 [Tanacetum coccineum]
MNPVAAQQIALDNALVAPEKRLKIKKCNARIEYSKPQREDIYGHLWSLKLSRAILLSLIHCEVLKYICINSGTPSRRSKIQMHTGSSWIRKSSELTLNYFVRSSRFVPDSLTKILLNLLPKKRWCISRKSSGLDRLRPLRSQILWGMYNTKNVDFVALLLNWINIHIVRDDSLLGTLKFVSNTQDYQKYGALIPEEMINQSIKDSKAYKIYLDFSTRKATPKKARKFKKVVSPSKKLSSVLEEEPAKKPKQAKKTPLLEATRFKKALKKIKQETHKRYSSGSGDGVGSQPKVPDESQDKTTSTNKGTGTIPGVLDVPKYYDADGDNEASDSERTDSDEDENPNLNQNDDEEEKYEEEYLRTPDNYEFSNDDDEYEDVNVRLKDAEHEKEGKGDADMTDVKTKGPMQSSSVSSDFASQFLNLDNVPPVDNEVVSMMNVKVRHEEPSTLTPSFLTILVTELSQLKQVDYSAQLLETIKSQIPAMINAQHSTRLEDSIQKAFRSYTTKFEKKAQGEKQRYIDLIEKSVKDIIKDEVKSQLPQILPKEVSDYATLVIQSTITESFENVLAKSSSQPKSTYEAATSLTEFELKKILLDKM